MINTTAMRHDRDDKERKKGKNERKKADEPWTFVRREERVRMRERKGVVL
jgi:hypothetical protein